MVATVFNIVGTVVVYYADLVCDALRLVANIPILYIIEHMWAPTTNCSLHVICLQEYTVIAVMRVVITLPRR